MTVIRMSSPFMSGASIPTTLLLLLSVFPLGHAQSTLTLVWLCTERPVFIGFSAGSNLGALLYGLQEISNDPDTLQGYDFDIYWVDSNCSNRAALGGLAELLATGVTPDIVLGPLCSSAMVSAGLLTAELDLPTFGWISSDPSVGDKTQYSTLVRLLYPVASIGEGILLLMDEMGWRKVYLISSIGGDYGELGRGTREVIQSNGREVVNWERDVDEDVTSFTIKGIYRRVKQEARIVILSIPLDDLRLWMLTAYDEGMHEGEYVFIFISQQTPDQSLYDTLTSADFITGTDGRDSAAKKAYKNLFMLFAKMNDFNSVDQYLSNFSNTTSNSSFINSFTPTVTASTPDFYSMFLYDSLKLYARVFREALDNGEDPYDGSVLFNRTRNTVTTGGATGDIIMDDNADRIPDYWLFDLRSSNQFAIIAETTSQSNNGAVTRTWTFAHDPLWGDGSQGVNNAPLDEPKCGFDGSKCTDNTVYIAVGCVLGFLLVLAVVLFFVIRKVLYERQLSDMTWKINYDELVLMQGAGQRSGSVMNLRSKSQMLRDSKSSLADSVTHEQLYIAVGTYHGTTVAVKRLDTGRVTLHRALLQEMRQLGVLKHTNINAFIGACVDPPNVCVCWEYAMKGSLKDVIWNESIALDDLFKFSIALDILKGLEYIHGSELRVHGNLKSSNIVVDSRFQCKLTDLHMRHMAEELAPLDTGDYSQLKGLLWTSPELLRQHFSNVSDSNTNNSNKSPTTPAAAPEPTQPDDVYSAAVVIKEVFARNDPYTEFEHMDLQDVLAEVRLEGRAPPFRPSLLEIHSVGSAEQDEQEGPRDDSVLEPLTALLAQLWAETPTERPSVGHAVKLLNRANPFKNTSVVDNLIFMMEKYSGQLEERVAAATQELDDEKKKTETLLLKMLPRSIAEDLKHGRPVDAEAFDSVTLYFSDIPGFSDFTSTATPVQVVDLLNAVYSMMDGVIDTHHVYKVETVGDVYVIAAGLPQRIGDRHVVEVANCALDLMSAVLGLRIPTLPNYKVQLRIGLHTGPIVTGVIGLAMPRYCLFGDTINTTSRMESTGSPMRIHMSGAAKEALAQFAGYHIADRGHIQVKGKGEMNTFWLLGSRTHTKPLPDFSALFKRDNQQATPLPVTTGRTARPSNAKPLRPSQESGYSEGGENAADEVTGLDTHDDGGDVGSTTRLLPSTGVDRNSAGRRESVKTVSDVTMATTIPASPPATRKGLTKVQGM